MGMNHLNIDLLAIRPPDTAIGLRRFYRRL